MAVRNFTEYFKDEREIFVQNLSNAQVSVEFPVAPNRVEGFLFPYSRDPINLTQHFPFAVIKSSTDLRKMVNRRPAVLQVLSDEEYTAYFAQKAKQRGLVDSKGKPDVEAAMDQAEESRRRTADKSTREHVTERTPDPIHEVVESGTGPGGMPHFGERARVRPSETFNEDEVINPRVLHLCNQVKAELKDEERMSAQDLLEALQQIPDLKLDDYEHIRAHSYYKTVKKWAKVETAKLSSKSDDDDDDEPEDKPSNKKSAGTQAQV